MQLGGCPARTVSVGADITVLDAWVKQRWISSRARVWFGTLWVYQGSLKDTHIGGMKQCKSMVIFGDLPFKMHCLGW